MQTCGLRVTVSKLEELATLAQPGASQPALVILDIRDRPTLSPTVAMLRRQHPTTGVVIVAASLEPALMLDAMRAGVTEFLTAPVTAPDLSAAITRVAAATAPTVSGEVFAFLGAKGGVGTTTVATNVATVAVAASQWHRRSSSTCIWPTETPRCTWEPSRGSRSSTRSKTCTGSTRPSSVDWSDTPEAGSRCWPRPIGRAQRRWTLRASGRSSRRRRGHYRYVVLDVPRSDVMIDALEPSARIVIVANQELAAVRGSHAAVGCAAATVRQGSTVGRRQPLSTSSRRSDRTTSNACSARQSRTRFPATTASRSRH